VRHFGDQGLGQSEEAAAFGGGFAPGQGDLRAGAGAEPFRRYPGVGLCRRWERSKATAIRAWRAAAADFRSSSSRISSIIPAQPVASGTAASSAVTAPKDPPRSRPAATSVPLFPVGTTPGPCLPSMNQVSMRPTTK
jgi:hypothetical protein